MVVRGWGHRGVCMQRLRMMSSELPTTTTRGYMQAFLSAFPDVGQKEKQEVGFESSQQSNTKKMESDPLFHWKKNESWRLPHTIDKNQLQVDCRRKSESLNNKASRRRRRLFSCSWVCINFLDRAQEAIILKETIHKLGFSSSKDTTKNEKGKLRRYMECWHLTKLSGTEHVKKPYKAQNERKSKRRMSKRLKQELYKRRYQKDNENICLIL